MMNIVSGKVPSAYDSRFRPSLLPRYWQNHLNRLPPVAIPQHYRMQRPIHPHSESDITSNNVRAHNPHYQSIQQGGIGSPNGSQGGVMVYPGSPGTRGVSPVPSPVASPRQIQRHPSLPSPRASPHPSPRSSQVYIDEYTDSDTASFDARNTSCCGRLGQWCTESGRHIYSQVVHLVWWLEDILLEIAGTVKAISFCLVAKKDPVRATPSIFFKFWLLLKR
jgi:hypothetical protein